MWKDIVQPPNLENNTMLENIGLYGNNLASNPKRIFIMSSNNSKEIKVLSTRNDQPFDILVQLRDFYDQVFNDMAVSHPVYTVMASSRTNTSQNNLAGVLSQQINGPEFGALAEFSGLTMLENPGNYSVSFSVTMCYRLRLV